MNTKIYEVSRNQRDAAVLFKLADLRVTFSRKKIKMVLGMVQGSVCTNIQGSIVYPLRHKHTDHLASKEEPLPPVSSGFD